MRKLPQSSVLVFAILICLSSCGFFGIHFKVHNPKRAGKYKNPGKEMLMHGRLTELRKKFDATFYYLDIFIDPEKKELSGWVEIRGVALSELDTLQIDLDQPLKIDELRSGTRNGESLKYSRKLRSVFIVFPSKIQAGETFSIHVKYRGRPLVARKPPWDGGLVWKKDKTKKHWCGVACEDIGASIWFPGKDHTSDEPDSVRLRFTIADTSLFVVSNGNYLGAEKSVDKKSFNWKISYPINLYNITFYLGNFVKIEDIYRGIYGKELMLNYYVLRPNKDKAGPHFKQLKKHLKVYEQLYGEYPWYNDGFKLVELPYKGMEHQTAIAYGNGYKNDLFGEDDYIILHETGHEWFGNAITASDLADVWIQEGITTYGEFLYLEKKDYANALSHLGFYRYLIKNKRPIAGPVGRRYFNYKDGDVYFKSAWILHTFRNLLKDDSLYFRIIKTFYEENKLKTTDTKTFINTVNRVSGKDYSWFFNQYLYNRKAPFIEYQVSDDKTIYYRWLFVADDFKGLPVSFTLGNNGTAYELSPTVGVQKLQLKGNDSFAEGLNFATDKVLYGVKKSKKLAKLYDRRMRIR